ncbi:MAG: hypothetical protein ABEI07_00375 [Candidatus Nanohaloarchaea archaeon]
MKRVVLLVLVFALIPLTAAGSPQLSVEVGSGQACVTESGSYTILLSNPGPAADRYEIRVDSPWKDSVTLSQSTVRVESGGTASVFLWIQVPKDASRGEHSFSVTARSSNTGKTTGSGEEIEVLSCRSVSLDPEEKVRKVCRVGEAVYRFEVDNTGQVEETYRLSAESGKLSKERITLEPGEDKRVRLTVSSREAVNRTIRVTAESTSSYASDTASVRFVAEECRGVDVTVAPQNVSVCRSDTLSLTASITNTGRITDRYRVSMAGKTENVTLGPGNRTTLTVESQAAALADNVQVTARSLSLSKVRDAAVAEVRTNECYGLSIDPVSIPGPGNQTLVQLSLANNGTKSNSYTLLLDGPSWMDVRPQNVTLSPGSQIPVYVYLAPDFFGDGEYTAALVVSGNGVRETIGMNVTARNGTVTVDLPQTETPTGRIGRVSSSLLPLIVTALILLFGGYWFFRREGLPPVNPSQTRDYHKSADDFLDQNANTVVKALREDSLSREFLNVLLEEESQGKGRDTVLNQIRNELEKKHQKGS